jgi:hypothetical protein
MSKISKYNPFWSTNSGNLKNNTILESKEEGTGAPDLSRPTIKDSEKTSKKDPSQQSPAKTITVHRMKRNSVSVTPRAPPRTDSPKSGQLILSHGKTLELKSQFQRKSSYDSRGSNSRGFRSPGTKTPPRTLYPTTPSGFLETLPKHMRRLSKPRS